MNQIQQGISLVCATKNRYQELRRLLVSLQTQTSQQFELILVDQNESDLLVDLVEEFKSNIKIIHLRHSFSSNTKARNTGAKYASCAWVGFPDDDCWYLADTIAKLLEQIKRVKTEGIFINWSDPLPAIPKKMFSFEAGIMKLDEAFTLASCICIFFKTETFQQVNGFNETMGLGNDTVVKAGEEQDLMLKIISQGGRIFKDPTNLVYHSMNERTWDEEFRNRIKSQGACDVYFTRKYKSWFQASKLQVRWFVGIFFNLLRGRKKNMQWYFYKLLGAITLAHKL
ncbi:MAG TPA: glycosyltransferase [Cyclobacteriaceae bacterium]|nr:glycosyltransferase [Cyclobacteriaceae bacterium]